MKCPNDSATLVMSERAGVEIDYCPECRGVWLDRGELDKIIAKAEAEAGNTYAPAQLPDSRFPTPARGDRDYSDRSRGYDGDDRFRRKKKESWLSELFD